MSSLVAEKVPAMDGSIRIVALKNNEPVGAWEFEKESISIGRSKTADVRLDDAAISRVHCIVEVRAAGVYVKDCGSRNGIWVAGVLQSICGRDRYAAIWTETCPSMLYFQHHSKLVEPFQPRA